MLDAFGNHAIRMGGRLVKATKYLDHAVILLWAFSLYILYDAAKDVLGPLPIRRHMLSSIIAALRGDSEAQLEHIRSAYEAAITLDDLSGKAQILYLWTAELYLRSLMNVAPAEDPKIYEVYGFLLDAIRKTESPEAWVRIRNIWRPNDLSWQMCRNTLKLQFLINRIHLGAILLEKRPPVHGPRDLQEVEGLVDQALESAAALLRDSDQPDRLLALGSLGAIVLYYDALGASSNKIIRVSIDLLSRILRSPRLGDWESCLLPWKGCVVPTDKLIAAQVLERLAVHVLKILPYRDTTIAVTLRRKAADLIYEARILGKLPGWKWSRETVDYNKVVQFTLRRLALFVPGSEARFYFDDSATFNAKGVNTPLPKSEIGYNGLKINFRVVHS